MIRLLIDAATAIVVTIDRLLTAVTNAARPQDSPLGAGAPSTGAETPASAGPGGHPHNSHAETLRCGLDGAEGLHIHGEPKCELIAERDGWRETAELRAGLIEIGRWLLVEEKWVEIFG